MSSSDEDETTSQQSPKKQGFLSKFFASTKSTGKKAGKVIADKSKKIGSDVAETSKKLGANVNEKSKKLGADAIDALLTHYAGGTLCGLSLTPKDLDDLREKYEECNEALENFKPEKMIAEFYDIFDNRDDMFCGLKFDQYTGKLKRQKKIKDFMEKDYEKQLKAISEFLKLYKIALPKFLELKQEYNDKLNKVCLKTLEKSGNLDIKTKKDFFLSKFQTEGIKADFVEKLDQRLSDTEDQSCKTLPERRYMPAIAPSAPQPDPLPSPESAALPASVAVPASLQVPPVTVTPPSSPPPPKTPPSPPAPKPVAPVTPEAKVAVPLQPPPVTVTPPAAPQPAAPATSLQPPPVTVTPPAAPKAPPATPAEPKAPPAAPAEPKTPPAAPKAPPAAPAEPKTPPATPAAPKTPPATPAAPKTPPATPAAPKTPPAAPKTPPATPAAPKTPPATPAAPKTPPAAPKTPPATPAAPKTPSATPAAPKTPPATPKPATTTAKQQDTALKLLQHSKVNEQASKPTADALKSVKLKPTTPKPAPAVAPPSGIMGSLQGELAKRRKASNLDDERSESKTHHIFQA